MTENLTIAETLNKAADYLQQYGWRQAGFGIHEGPRYAVGALMSASGDLENFLPTAEGPFAKYLDPSGYLIVPGWNDEPGRTATEVIEALRACAVIAESRETVTSTHTAGLPGSPVSA